MGNEDNSSKETKPAPDNIIKLDSSVHVSIRLQQPMASAPAAPPPPKPKR
jgi:hypothetical protein